MASDDAQTLKQRLIELKAEHQALHDLIETLSSAPYLDQLRLRRLKKRKLQVKDMIAWLEDRIIPDLDA